MANKRPTSAPLFGNPTVRDVRSVQEAIEAYTTKLILNKEKARKVLTGAEPVMETARRKK